ncbi:MAG: acetate kinase [Clostridia bacterium]|nr:acetate kinase [Clostridia bacterium]MBR6299661.1 acetate kinase [Clostridia bacterium]
MKILIVNAGSSSLKYQLVDMDGERVLAKGLVERIGIAGSKLTQKYPDSEEKFVIETDMPTHVQACENMLKALTNDKYGVVSSMDEIGAVGHRVLHGGEKFTESVVINDKVMDAIRENIPLGPLHNPANLMGIEACQQVMPGTPMVAVFDTAFHQTMPPKAYLYGVPYKYYLNLHVRRYGFHGTSHRYVSKRAAEFLGKKAEDMRIITCHLGNGSSMCAVDHGKCVDTSMGITPLEGVVMGTRSGSLDPAVLQFIMNNAKNENGTPEIKDIDDMLNVLNKKSGLLGISGISSDMRDVDAAADAGDKRAQVARDMLVYGIRKYIGAYAAAMGGVDAIVFTAGIGENGVELREKVMEGFEYMGAKLDPEKNKVRGEERDVSADDSKVKVLVIPTNEEIVIARDTLELVTK